MALELRASTLSLLSLCDEVLLHIFTFLDLPDLLSCSRVRSTASLATLVPTDHANRPVTASGPSSAILYYTGTAW